MDDNEGRTQTESVSEQNAEDNYMARRWMKKTVRENLYNQEVHNLYSLPHIVSAVKSRMVRQMGHAACKGNNRNACKVSVTKYEGKRPFLLKTQARKEANIEMDLNRTEESGLAWL